jgi:copper chaperone CopZ
MAIIKSFSPFQNLSNFQTFLVDDNPLSDYFRITEFKDTFTGGKNGFLIEGSEFLKETTEVKIELLDVAGNPIYFEPGDGIPEYYEGTSKLVSVHVYDDTPIGLGKITILGELKNYVDGNGSVIPVPSEWKGVYNVKWERTFKVNKNLNNEDIVRFYKRPLVNIDELVKPIFTKSVNQVTDSESTVTGVAQLPNAGTNLSTYRGGTFYKLIKSVGSWDIDVDENIIDVTVDGSSYSPKIIEVLNDREVLVDIPYTDNSIVGNFVSQSYSVTYTDFQNETIGESALTGSFAKIDITQLKTFVGDVARVKVFRKSRSSATDFQFVQESRLESTELLRDITTTENTELSYGRFDESNLLTYWVTTNVDHPAEIDSSILSQAVKVDYDTNQAGVQKLITSQSFSISKDVEYTLNFRTLLSGSISDEKYLKAYFSGSYENGSPFTQSFVDITPDGSYVVRKNITENVIAERNIDAKLVFEFKGDDWYISNVSLRNAQDTSFSPDEFTLIQDIPRKLASETFDFRFEFYDINNNYIPVNVIASKTFNGGNDFNTTSKLLTFESDRNAFRYISGSASPASQQIQFKTTIQNLTGSIVYNSGAFDEDGNLIPDTDWTVYPGLLTNPSNNGGLVTVSSFEGTWGGVDPKPEVFSIIYTASIEELEEFETVYRLEDGENAPTLLVTSNANQFIYEPTTLSPKPSGQSITIRAQRKNLATIDTPITIFASSSLGYEQLSGSAEITSLGHPDISGSIVTSNGVSTYTLTAQQFSASFAQTNFDEVTYEFTGSDVFGVEQSDEITLSKVVNFDGVSIVLSNESTTLSANSLGFVSSSDFVLTSGSATVYVGSNPIQFDDNGGKNTFEITNLQGTNCTPNGTGNGYDPTTNEYGITAISADQAQLDVTVTYTAGDGVTSQSFAKGVSYTRVKSSPPILKVEIDNSNQTVAARSTNIQTGSFENVTFRVIEDYNGVETIFEGPNDGRITNAVSTVGGFNPTVSPMIGGWVNGSPGGDYEIPSSSNSVIGAFGFDYEDSEGSIRRLGGSFSLSKIKRNPPVLSTSITNNVQTVPANSIGVQSGSFVDSVITVTELYNNVERELPLTFLIAQSSEFSNITTDFTTGIISMSAEVFPQSDDNSTVGVYGNVIDSEGVEKTFQDNIVTSKVRSNPPLVQVISTPQSQTITSSSLGLSTPTDIEISVFEAEGVDYTFTTSASGSMQPNTYNLYGKKSNCTDDGLGNIVPIIPDPIPSDGFSGSYQVNYTNSEGTYGVVNGKFSIGIAIQGTNGESGSDGSTGPGIVFRGPWDAGTSYQFDLDTSRRDSVLYNDIYYASLQPSLNQAPTGHLTDNAYWQSLGQEDFFVAAKIAIFEESFIKNTLNIGLNAAGDTANITLAGGITSPYLSIGQSPTGVYGANGIFLGQDSGASKFSVSNSSTGNYLKWTGDKLELSGDLNFGNGDQILQTGDFTLGNGNISWDGNTLNITGNITVTNSDDFADPNAEPNDPNQDNPSTYAFGNGAGAFDLKAATAATGLNLTSEFLGYYDGVSGQWKSYMDSSGNFYLGGNSGALQWNGATLSLAGDLNLNSTNPANGAFADSGIFLSKDGWISAKEFYISSTGTARFAGNIESGATITGADIIGGTLTGGNIKIYNDNIDLIAASSTFDVNFGVGSWSTDGGGFINWRTDSFSGNRVARIFTSTSSYSALSLVLETNGNIDLTTAGVTGGYVSATGNITATGNIIAYYSDERLKTNLGGITNPLSKIKSLNGFYYTNNELAKSMGYDDTDVQVGISAQEVQKVLPEIVKRAPIDMDRDNPKESRTGNDYLTVQYERIVPLLIEGIKELTNKVEILEEEIKKLKGK